EYQQKFFDSMSVKDVYRHIGEYIENYVPFDRMMLLARDLQDEDKGKVVVAKGEDSDFFKDMEFSLNDKGVLVYALNRSIPVERLLKNDKADYTIRFNSEERRNDSLHYLCATSSTSDIPIANFTIALEKKNPSAYSEHDKIRLRTIARTASFALERVVQFEKGKDLAMRDGLTGLMNHRTMHEKLNIEKMRAERQKINIGLLMMDIDKFKSINDTYGHPAGDEIIKGIARTIVTEVRSEIDIVARYGGEEFVVALIDTSEVGLKETAERIRLAIERASFDIKQKLPLKVTVSIGAYLKRPDGRYSMAESLKFADSALYKAKEGGRNQVVEYLETEPENSTISEEENR
ncbi:MAG: GGDEF domain-containing protein, partial [Fibrobacteraceae bacterium]|nr:GGDEF domain-containing protein [Fibrobacteraceae bacterium]